MLIASFSDVIASEEGKGLQMFLSFFCKCESEYYDSLIYRFAYVEFTEKESITKALELDDSLFKGRQIKVSTKANV